MAPVCGVVAFVGEEDSCSDEELLVAEKIDEGLAIRKTPMIDTNVAICSVRVNGSLISLLQAQQASIGARKVSTVASERGRYCSDPTEIVKSHSSRNRLMLLTIQPEHAEKATDPTCDQQTADFSLAKREIFDFLVPHVKHAQSIRDAHSSEQNLRTDITIRPSSFFRQPNTCVLT